MLIYPDLTLWLVRNRIPINRPFSSKLTWKPLPCAGWRNQSLEISDKIHTIGPFLKGKRGFKFEKGEFYGKIGET
jgi:hypothetical protein